MKRYTHILILIISFFSFSCKENVQIERLYPDYICVYFPPNTVGDCHYSDLVYQGIVSASLENEFSYYLYDIEDWASYQSLLGLPLVSKENELLGIVELPAFTSYLLPLYNEKLYNDEDEIGVDHKLLFILTDPYFKKFLDVINEDENYSYLVNDGVIDFLLIDSPPVDYGSVYTISFSSYAPYYLAGQLTRNLLSEEDTVSSFLFTDDFTYYQSLQDSIEGFKQGYYSGKTEEIYLTNLAQEYYPEADESIVFQLGQKMYEYASGIQNKVILPLCRGNIYGFLRYNRENKENSFYTIGNELNFNEFTNQVPFSVERKINLAVEDWILDYFKGDVEKHRQYTLESDYINVIISEDYEEKLNINLESLKNEALLKEKFYEANIE